MRQSVFGICYCRGQWVKNGRLLLKADDRFFEILEEHVPGRIRVPQADIVFYASVRADAVKIW